MLPASPTFGQHRPHFLSFFPFILSVSFYSSSRCSGQSVSGGVCAISRSARIGVELTPTPRHARRRSQRSRSCSGLGPARCPRNRSERRHYGGVIVVDDNTSPAREKKKQNRKAKGTLSKWEKKRTLPRLMAILTGRSEYLRWRVSHRRGCDKSSTCPDREAKIFPLRRWMLMVIKSIPK